MRRNQDRNQATTFWSACDWLCCASSSAVRAPEVLDGSRNRSRSSCHSVYEVVNENNAVNNNTANNVPHSSAEGRSPTVSGKNSRKVSPIQHPALSQDHAVLRQKFEPGRKLTVLSTTQSESQELCRTFAVPAFPGTSPASLNASATSHEWRKSAQPAEGPARPPPPHKFSLVESRPETECTPRDTQSLPSSRSFVYHNNNNNINNNNNANSDQARLSGRLMEELNEELPDQEDLEILGLAAKNYDITDFQVVLHEWLKSQIGCRGCAFVLNSSEDNTSVCHVCNGQLLDKPIQCGDTQTFVEALGFSTGCNANYHDSQPGPSRVVGPSVINVQNLGKEVSAPISEIVSQIGQSSGAVAASVCVLMTACGFCTVLVVAHRSEESRGAELNALLPHFGMIAGLLAVTWNVEEQRRIAEQSEKVLSMTQSVFSSLQDMQLLVRNITREAKALVSAEICSLFLLDAEHEELVAEVFEQKGTSEDFVNEIRMPLNQGIVGHVATTGELMNVRDVYNHPYFYPNVDQMTGFKTRNILCFPIKDNKGNLVGVAELCNKIDKPAFTLHDEQVAMTFAVYCAISISHCLMYRKLQEAHRRSHMAAEVLVQASTLAIAPEDVLRLTVREIPKPESFHGEFSCLSFVPRSIGTGDIYVEASLSMFQELGFIENYRLKRRTLARFILMVQKGYRDVPYHNWSHAFSVAHFCYLLERIPTVSSFLSELERLSLLVACLCHDIDHRGTTNAFQLQSRTPLAQLYSSEGSVLERHHFAQTVTILGMDECNIFETLTRQQYQAVLDNIREVILATDIAAHLRKVQRIKHMVSSGYDVDSPEHHYLFMCLLMTASDLSDQSKDFKNSKAIAENIYKEFFSQGDLEKSMGNKPLEMMDRDKACVPKIQLEFMDTVALPVFEHLGKILPDTVETYESFKHNRTCWAVLDQLLEEDAVPQAGLNYLKDSELERKVFERVDGKQEEEQVEQEEEKDADHLPV